MSCEVCGLSGLHSCPGYWLELPAQEDERKLQEVLYKIFGEVEDNLTEEDFLEEESLSVMKKSNRDKKTEPKSGYHWCKSCDSSSVYNGQRCRNCGVKDLSKKRKK